MVKFVISVKALIISGIALLVLLGVGIGVNAYNPSASANPAVMGHSLNEIAPPDGCQTGQTLQRAPINLGWNCVNIPSGNSNPTTVCSGENKVMQWNGNWVCATVSSISV